MRLRTKLVVRGAVLPSVFLVGAIVAGGILFERSLVDALDASLRAQASVESVSLFDQPAPHLHDPEVPLFPGLEANATSRVLFDDDGAPVAVRARAVDAPERLPEATAASAPLLRTRPLPSGVEIRELVVPVRAPNGREYFLWLAQSMEPVRATVRAYVRTVGSAGLLALVVFFVQQTLFARHLAARIRNLSEHMARLMKGDLASRPGADDVDDELGELRASIASATEKLEHARHAQERLVADAAHELRTPLAALRANIDVTLRRERDVAELRSAFGEMREEVDRLGNLATKLLELARGRVAKWMMTPQNLRSLLEETIQAQRGRADRRQIAVTLAAPDKPIAACDADAIRQAFDNLLANALEFSPPSSRVAITVEPSGEAWRIAFADQGPGVPEPLREEIFEPFRRLDTEHAGSGLGLAIVRNIVERHGGQVTVEPATAGATGATFVVMLPKATA